MKATETKTYHLKLPSELKNAAQALIGASFCEPVRGSEVFFNHIYLFKIDNAIIYLMRAGLRSTLDHIDAELKRVSEEHRLWQQLVDFFLQNPAAECALPANFEDGTSVKSLVSMHMEEAARVAEDSEMDFEGADGLPRKVAFDELAIAQRQLERLVAAKGAIQKAL